MPLKVLAVEIRVVLGERSWVLWGCWPDPSESGFWEQTIMYVALAAHAHLERLLAGEVQWVMQKMFRQYDAIADLLLPTELVPNNKAITVAESSPAGTQPGLNFGE